MKHTKRRKRHTLRRRNTRRKRTLRGGSASKANNECMLSNNDIKSIKWPPDDGCKPGTKKKVIIPVNTVINRFGKPDGRYVTRVSKNNKLYSWKERALPYINPTNSNGKSCRNTYNRVKPEYHQYKVLKNIEGVEQCITAPFAGHTGNAIQLKLPEPVEYYKMQELTTSARPKFNKNEGYQSMEGQLVGE